MHFFDISTSKSGSNMWCFQHFHLEMCFAPHRRAMFHLSSGQLAPHPTPPTHHHQQHIINATHHQHSIINTSPSTHHHQHNTINNTPSTQHHRGRRSSTRSTSGSFCVVLRGRRSTWSTFIEVSGSPATSDGFGRRVVSPGRRSTWSTSGLFCVAGAALGAPQVPFFAWQAQHLEHLHRGQRKSATSDDVGRSVVLRGRRSTWSISSSFCVAGAAHGAPQVLVFAWQAQHLEHLRVVLRGRRSTSSTSGLFCVAGAAVGAPPACFAWQAQRLEHLRVVLRGTTSSYYKASQYYFVLQSLHKARPSTTSYYKACTKHFKNLDFTSIF